MDRKLGKLLKILEEDARYSHSDISSMLGENEEKVSDVHVTALIELKVIPQKNLGFEEIAERIMQMDEVESVYLMAGVYDLALIVRGQTMQDIAMFVAKKLSTIEGVLSTGTHFIMQRYKDRGVNLIDFEGENDERSLIL